LAGYHCLLQSAALEITISSNDKKEINSPSKIRRTPAAVVQRAHECLAALGHPATPKKTIEISEAGRIIGGIRTRETSTMRRSLLANFSLTAASEYSLPLYTLALNSGSDFPDIRGRAVTKLLLRRLQSRSLNNGCATASSPSKYISTIGITGIQTGSSVAISYLAHALARKREAIPLVTASHTDRLDLERLRSSIAPNSLSLSSKVVAIAAYLHQNAGPVIGREPHVRQAEIQAPRLAQRQAEGIGDESPYQRIYTATARRGGGE
jgi:hypothetical protein